MSHKSQQVFCRSIKEKHPEFFRDCRVLDVGSLDINGSNRGLFDNCSYIGLDIAPGRNVDLVGFGHEMSFNDEYFYTIISTECFEHDAYFPRTLKNIVRMLKRGGLLLTTCATDGRLEHGTINREPNDSPLTVQREDLKTYYKNLGEEDFRQVIDVDAVFSVYQFNVLSDVHDLQFWGIKR